MKSHATRCCTYHEIFSTEYITPEKFEMNTIALYNVRERVHELICVQKYCMNFCFPQHKHFTFKSAGFSFSRALKFPYLNFHKAFLLRMTNLCLSRIFYRPKEKHRNFWFKLSLWNNLVHVWAKFCFIAKLSFEYV